MPERDQKKKPESIILLTVVRLTWFGQLEVVHWSESESRLGMSSNLHNGNSLPNKLALSFSDQPCFRERTPKLSTISFRLILLIAPL
jgi:hypothetical protein